MLIRLHIVSKQREPEKVETKENKQHTPRVVIMFGVIGLCLFLSVSVSGANTSEIIDYHSYGATLSAYVDDHGMVDYNAMKANRRDLDAFATALTKLDPKIFEGWKGNEKIAFWINAYNALTLQTIIDHYPIKPSRLTSLVYPQNSIRQIPGVWDRIKFPVMGRGTTLDGIEHEILRKNFNEPRIHMALVCAAMGCPPLRNEPYTGEKLDAQLDDQTLRFLSDPKKFHVDPDNGLVYLSPIFKWFGGDFVRTYGTGLKTGRQTDVQRAAMKFIQKYIDETDARYLATGGYGILYLDYDWSLNEQEGGKGETGKGANGEFPAHQRISIIRMSLADRSNELQ